MTTDLGEILSFPRKSVEQPPEDVQWVTADKVFIKQLFIKEAGTLVPQHSHVYDHTTMLAVGAVRVWCDGRYIGDYVAPQPILIENGVKHTFMALQPNTLLYCIHNLSRSEVVEILAEHQLDDGDY